MRLRDIPVPAGETEQKPEQKTENLTPDYQGTTKEKMEQAEMMFRDLFREMDAAKETTETSNKLDPEKLYADFGYKKGDFLQYSIPAEKIPEKKDSALNRFIREMKQPDPDVLSFDSSDIWLGLQDALAKDAKESNDAKDSHGFPKMRDSAHTDFKESYERFSDSKLYKHKFTFTRKGVVRVSGANCETYAYNLPLDVNGSKYPDNPYPGYYGGADLYETMKKLYGDMRYGSVETLKKTFKELMDLDMAALGREMREVSGDYQPKEGERMIAVTVAPWIPMGLTEIADYHFYVRDSDGYWSHKRGVTNPTRLDDNGQLITDPATCERGYYTKFLGYYVMREEEK